MTRYEKLVLRYIKKEYPNFVLVKVPSWLKEYRWRPDFLLRESRGERELAVQIILSATIPRFQYRNIVSKIQKRRRNLTIVIVTLDESYDKYPEIEEFCKNRKIGLKIIIPKVGLQTIITTDLDGIVIRKEITLEEGWFPNAILEEAKGLQNIFFSDIIDRFVDNVTPFVNNADKTRNLVFETITSLLNINSGFSENLEQFVRLARFEEMLQSVPPERSDHVFHSFRVFLAGCPIIDKFYNEFIDAHRRFCIEGDSNISVEYTWLLTSIFHDIGRLKETHKEILETFQEEFQEEGIEFSMKTEEDFWTQPHIKDVRRILGSLAYFIGNCEDDEQWHVDLIEGEEYQGIVNDWIRIYGEFKHSIVSAFDFFRRIVQNAYAASEKKNRPFIFTHAAPAAMSILLHDYRIWEEAAKWNLYPIDASILPMAALLIYIDTWDDFKRRGEESRIYIKDYTINNEGACVTVEWGSSEELNKEKLKYDSYKKVLNNAKFNLTINAVMAE